MPHYLKFVPRSQARNNMSVRVLPGGAVEWDSPEDLPAVLAYQQATGKAPRATAAQKAAALKAGRRQHLEERAKPPQRTGRQAAFVVKPEDASKPVSDGQGKMIAAAIGGLEVLCGGREAKEAARAAGVYSSHILSQMGLTYGGASVVIDTMKRAGVYGFNQSNPEAAAAARDILFNIGSVVCPAKKNCGARRNRGTGRGR